MVWTLCFYRASSGHNPYAKPIHWLHAVVDLEDMAVVRVEDLGTVALRPGTGGYTAGSSASRSRPVAPARPVLVRTSVRQPGRQHCV